MDKMTNEELINEIQATYRKRMITSIASQIIALIFSTALQAAVVVVVLKFAGIIGN